MSAFLFVTPTWDGQAWARHMRTALPHHDVRVWPDVGERKDVHYVAAWLPPPDVVKSLPDLKVIFSLGAGVDAILSDPSLPENKPIVRIIDPDMTMRMSEHVVMHTLLHHRQLFRIVENQRNKTWDLFEQHAASALRVGVMGLGILGADAATKLAIMGFQTAGWSRSKKSIPNVACYAGENELDTFLARTDVLVCLLPATPDTNGILNKTLISKLSRSGPFGAPVLISAGRGSQQNDQDILAALNSGALHAASLDVFEKEPLPPESPFWSHPKVIVTSHAAADSDPATICRNIARQVIRYEQDGSLQNVVDRQRGY
jgi:glyoxylate/hydroxypyruvate reductase